MSTSLVFAAISGLLVVFLFMMLNLMKTWIANWRIESSPSKTSRNKKSRQTPAFFI